MHFSFYMQAPDFPNAKCIKNAERLNFNAAAPTTFHIRAQVVHELK